MEGVILGWKHFLCLLMHFVGQSSAIYRNRSFHLWLCGHASLTAHAIKVPLLTLVLIIKCQLDSSSGAFYRLGSQVSWENALRPHDSAPNRDVSAII